MKNLLLLGSLTLLAMACEAQSSVQTTNTPEQWTQPTTTHEGSVDIAPGSVGGAKEGKWARRVTVDQLRRSIPTLFDGITWNIAARGRQVPGFDVLASTLGEPDYLQTTASNLDPSPLFAKFMDDMAADVCRQAVDRDRTANAVKLVIQHPDNIQQNLRFLRLKLHGIHVPSDSMEGLGELATLYSDILSGTNDPDQAWWGVCIAMLTAPETLAY